MTNTIRKTVFAIDKDLCTGCGQCTGVCIMRILKIVDGYCSMVDGFKCLECGSCIEECPQHAIKIENVCADEATLDHALPIEKINVTPILKELTKIMAQELSPVQLNEFGGRDIKKLDDFEMDGEKCYTRLYQIDKLEKTSISLCNFYGLTCTQIMCLTPSDSYDFPTYVMDWTEAEESIYFLCDLLPGDDPGRNRDYLANLYDNLDDLYHKYSNIKGLAPNEFHWCRALVSPYHINGYIDKSSTKSVEKTFNCAIDYFKTWINIWKDAKLQDPKSGYMKLVKTRRKTIRELFQENDPGEGTLSKFMGEEMAHIMMEITMP
jgi:ferredoxin